MGEIENQVVCRDAFPVKNLEEEEEDIEPTSASHNTIIRTRSGRVVQSTRQSDFDYEFTILSSAEVPFSSFKALFSLCRVPIDHSLSDSDAVSIKPALCTTHLRCEHALRHTRTFSMDVLLPPLEVPNPKKAQGLNVMVTTTASAVALEPVCALLTLTTKDSMASAPSSSSSIAVAMIQLQSAQVPCAFANRAGSSLKSADIADASSASWRRVVRALYDARNLQWFGDRR